MSEAARIDLVDRAPLTEKQQNVYESIMQYQRVNGYAPTIREICKMVGVASTSSVYAHLKILEDKGYIARKMDASRANTTITFLLTRFSSLSSLQDTVLSAIHPYLKEHPLPQITVLIFLPSHHT